jgi:hypothetical protein
MTDDERTELTPEELQALGGLPRERAPGDLLEERTVQALYDRGLLGGRRVSSPKRLTHLASGVAAAVALFVSGVAVGQWLGGRSVTETVRVVQQDNALQAAAMVQQAGSRYVTALADLVRLADYSTDPAIAQGREAALTALFAAATEVARIAPDDPAAAMLQQILARMREPGAVDRVRNVVWF